MSRILTALVAIPLLFAYVRFLPAGWFHGLAVLIGTLALFELYAMARLPLVLRGTGLAAGLFIMILSALGTLSVPFFLGVAVLLALVRMFSIPNPEKALYEVSVGVFGILYIAGLVGYQMKLRAAGVDWVIFLWVTVWAADATALYAGRAFGKRKLYPAMSPNKTVEGAVGSLLGGIAGASAINGIFGLTQPGFAVLLGIVLSLSAQIGDLVESMIKRDTGVKDSSPLVPGHGGVFDKIDAALLAAPVLYYLGLG